MKQLSSKKWRKTLPILCLNKEWCKILVNNNPNHITHKTECTFSILFSLNPLAYLSPVITPKTTSHGPPRKWMSNLTRTVQTQVKFWKFHVYDVILWNLTIIFAPNSLTPVRNFLWVCYKWLIFLSPRRVSPFLACGDFHARSRFARCTIPEDKWGTTRSLPSKLKNNKGVKMFRPYWWILSFQVHSK